MAVAAVIGCVGPAAAQNGTLGRRTVTFSTETVDTVTIRFTVPSVLVGDSGQPPSTTLVLEFSQEGIASVVNPFPSVLGGGAPGGGVGFTLSLGAHSLPSFGITNLPSGNTTFTGKQISMTRPDAPNTPGLFVLSIVHTANTQSSETWELRMTVRPALVPMPGVSGPRPLPVRGIASLFGSQSGFSFLQPAGVCPKKCPTPHDGTLGRRTVTFSKSSPGTGTIRFTVPSVLVGDPGQPPSTTLVLELARDGTSSVVDPFPLGRGSGVDFALSLGAQSLPPFDITNLPSGNTTFAGKQISMAQPDPQNTPGLFVLSIVHAASTQSSETWELGMTLRPAHIVGNLEMRPVRATSSLSGSQSGFSFLQPTGACGEQCPFRPSGK